MEGLKYKLTFNNPYSQDLEVSYQYDKTCPICSGELKQESKYMHWCNNCMLQIEIEPYN